MDQAALLREMMKELQDTEDKKTKSLAFVSTSTNHQFELYLERLVDYLGEKMKCTYALLGVEKTGHTLQDWLSSHVEYEQIKENHSTTSIRLNGSLQSVTSMKEEKESLHKFLTKIKELEKEVEAVVYYAGAGLTATTVNLSLLSQKIILFMEPTTKSVNEVKQFITVFSKLRPNGAIGLMVNTLDPQIFQEQINKIQEFSRSEFNYTIEPVGFFDVKYLALLEDKKLFEQFNVDYVEHYQVTRNLSEVLESMVL